MLPVSIKAFENMVKARSEISIYVSRIVCFVSNNRRYLYSIIDLFLPFTIKLEGWRKGRNRYTHRRSRIITSDMPNEVKYKHL